MSHSINYTNLDDFTIKDEFIDDEQADDFDDEEGFDDDPDGKLNTSDSWIQVPVVQTLTVLSDGESKSQNETSVVNIIKNDNGIGSIMQDDSMLSNEDLNDSRKRVGRPVTSQRTMAQNFPPINVICMKLETGECYTRARASHSSSEVWSIFEEIAYTATNEFTNIVRCKLCFFMTRYHGQITGTSHMRRHSCFVKSFPNSVKSSEESAKKKLKTSSPQLTITATPSQQTPASTTTTVATITPSPIPATLAIGLSSTTITTLLANNGSNSTTTTTNNNNTSISNTSGTKSKPDILSTIAQVYNLEKFSELRDAVSSELLNYNSCKVCRAVVKHDTQALNGHLCKQKDIERQSANASILSSLLFRSKPQNRATPIWEDFEEVLDPTTNLVLSYVRCKKCTEIFKASDPKSIPSVLRRHQARCPMVSLAIKSMMIMPVSKKSSSSGENAIEKKQSITTISLPLNSNTIKTLSSSSPSQSPTIASTSTNSSITVTPKMVNAKADFRERCIQFCYQELVSLESVTSDSFKKLAQTLMSLGAQYGRSTLVLPDVNQLKQQMLSNYHLIKTQIKNEISFEFNSNIGGALVCDSHDDLCILTCYYINSINWQLTEAVIGATTSASDINAFITTTLNDYGLNEEDRLSKMTFVSRGGLFDGVNICLFSVAHTIDNIIESTLFADDTFTDVIENCRMICNQIKLDINIDNRVKSVDWLQKFTLMREVYDNQDKFELKDFSVDMELVSYLVDLLSPFKDASIELRNCSKHPTLNHVLLWYHKLMKVLNISSEEMNAENTFHKNIKTALKASMEQNFHLHSLHKIAAFLWPNFRFLKMLSTEERATVHADVRNFIEQRVTNDDDASSAIKKARSDFSDWEDITDLEQDELDKYISAMLTSCNELNILHWWKEHQADFPKLSHLAKWILSIPASVTSLERYRLTSTQCVDNELLFLHCNLRKTDEEKKIDEGKKKMPEKLK